MPMGVPTPPFGMDSLQAGAVTVTKTQSDSISGTLAAGTVMVVSGTHDSVSINASNCSEAQPCFIQGGTYTGTLAVTAGHYLVLENITAYNPDLSGDHLVLRHSVVAGDLAGGGVFASASYIFVHHNYIHDIGNLTATTDIDRHCIPVQNNSHHYWILWNLFTRCSGDSVQVNAGIGNGANVHHIYIGGNIATNNRQTCFWAKQSTDVVISQNFCYHMRPSSGGQGDGIGTQYGSNRLVILNNRIWDTSNGINLRSSDSGVNSPAMVAGNVIYGQIHSTGTSEATVNSQADGACIIAMTSGTVPPSKHAIYYNTCYGPHGGIQIPGGAATTYIGYNIISQASIVAIIREGVTSMVINTNVFYPSASITGTTGTNNIVGDPLFTSTTDFRLGAASPAKGVATDDLNTFYALLDGSSYMTNHGIDLPSIGTDAGAFTDLFLKGSN